MDRELHEELTQLHLKIGLVVQRTDQLPATLSAINDRVTELEKAQAAHQKVHDKLHWTVAGAGGALSACWTAAYFVFRELFK